MTKSLKELQDAVGKLLQDENWDELIPVASEIIRLATDAGVKASAHGILGVCYEKRNEIFPAKFYHSMAVALNPDDATLYQNRGVFYAHIREYDNAVINYREAINLRPEHPSNHYNLGLTYDKLGEYDRAIAHFDEAIRLNYEGANAYNSRGVAYGKKGDFDRAIADFKQAISLNSDCAPAYGNLGRVYGDKGDYENAIKIYNQLIERNLDKATTYHDRALVYFRYQKYELAFHDLLEADKRDLNLKRKLFFVYIAVKVDRILSNEQAKNEVFMCYGKSAVWVSALQRRLFHCPEPMRGVAHYTSLHALKFLSNRKNKGCFRLYNSAYMNDPEEGKILFQMLGIKNLEKVLYKNQSKLRHHSSVYIGSFVKPISSSQKDDLFLWRTYGKHDSEDAAGACLLFDEANFAKEHMPRIGTIQQGEWHESEQGAPLLALYNVCYSDDSILKDEEFLSFLAEFKASLEEIQKLCEDKSCNKSRREGLKTLARELLDSIRFLFKAKHYKEENEVRVVGIHYDDQQVGYAPDRVKVDAEQIPPRFYLELPETFRFSEVLLGPKTQRVEEWKRWLCEQGSTIKVDQTEIKYGNS